MKNKLYQDPDIGAVVLAKSTRSRRINIRVHPLKGVTVTMPYFVRYDDGVRFFLQKKEWVLEALRRQRKQVAEAEKSGTAVGVLGDGSVVRTLLSRICFRRGGNGNGRRAVVTVSSSVVEDVKQTGRLYLSPDLPLSRKEADYQDFMPSEGSAELSSLLSGVLVKILRDEARSLLPQKLSFFAGRYGFSYGKVTIKHNSSNWGSCSARGNINLNLNLVRLPEPVCDYVILHELCHLKHPDHGAEFHALLEKLCLDNMKRLFFLVDSLQAADGFPVDPGIKASKDYFHGLLSAMHRSRAKFPVHHVLEQEVKKYRLI